jgi:hypothetical protein
MASTRRVVGSGVAFALIGGLVLAIAACKGGDLVRPVGVASTEPAAGTVALVGTLAKRRAELGKALVWVGEGPRRLALHDRAAPGLEVDVLGPHRAGQSDLDVLISDAQGKAASLLKLGFSEPDGLHRGYWIDDAGKTPPGMPEDDDDGVSPSINRVMSLIETVYLTIWVRPVDYVLRYDRTGS